MRVAIIGPGRVGTALALALPRTGHRVVAVTGRSEDAMERFGRQVAGVRRCATAAEAAGHAELVIVATPDAVVGEIVRGLMAQQAVNEGHKVIHLAGSLGLDVLRPAALAGARIAAIHPAQTVPAGADAEVFVGAAFAVTTSASDREWAHELVRDLGGDPHDLRDEERTAYHAALVLGSNAVAAAASAARQLLLSIGVEDPSAFLAPLAHRSLDNALERGASALTGPVVRGDVATIGAHLAALDADRPELAAAYRHLQRAVLAQARLGLSADVQTALRDALADPT